MGSKPVGLSASRGAGVLGLSKYTTQVEAWLEIMEARHPGFCEAHGYVTPIRVETAPLRWGTHFEDVILELAAAKTGIRIVDREKLYEGPGDLNFVTCHVDGRYEDTRKLHEGKHSNIRAFGATYGTPGTNRLPTYIQVQVQQQMYLANANENIVSVLVFPIPQVELEKSILVGEVDPHVWSRVFSEMGLFHQFPVERHPISIEAMLDHYRMFWDKCVIGEQPPESSDYEDLRKLFPSPSGTVIADDEVERLSAEYKDLSSEIKGLEKRKREIKGIIVKYATDEAAKEGASIDEDSTEKIIVMDRAGRKIHSYNGKLFR